MTTDSPSAAKRLVLDCQAALEAASVDAIPTALERFTTPDYRWRGYHPFGELHGARTVAEVFWQPLAGALTSLHRRSDILMAGRNTLDDGATLWVCSMGHLAGLLDTSWLGLPATGRMAFLRSCEFHRIEDGRIAETAFYFDLPHLMTQAGLTPFPDQAGAQLVQPGPRTHDGLMVEPAPPAEGLATLALIEAMIGDLGQWRSTLPLEEELARTWHPDMTWWGPTGIGATFTIERYARQHAGPFRAAFGDRSPTRHVCRMAEGHYGGFFGWPNFSAVQVGEYLGRPPTGRRTEFRVIDLYRRDGERLAENWVFIDLLHVLAQWGVDLLGDLTGRPTLP